MSFNRQNYIRLSEEYRQGYRLAEARAEDRRAEIHMVIPEIAKIDRALATVSSQIMAAAMQSHGKEDALSAIEQIRAQNQAMNERRRALLRENGYPENYTEPRYACTACGDTGFVGTSVCECLRRALVDAGYDSAGIRAIKDKCSFETFSLEYYRSSPEHYQRMSQILRTAREYAEGFTLRSDNLLLVGGTGLGKTHLSVAIAKAVVERGYDVKYTSAIGMISDFEAQRFGNSSGAAQGAGDTSVYFGCELLVIDDLGTEMNNQFTSTSLYNLINLRLDRGLPTVISTNLSPQDLRTRYWDRITSRMFGEYRILPFIGKDVRMQKITQ